MNLKKKKKVAKGASNGKLNLMVENTYQFVKLLKVKNPIIHKERTFEMLLTTVSLTVCEGYHH